MNTIIEKLSQIGMSEKEALIYMAALDNGPSTVIQLAQMTGIKRSTVYTVIDSLFSAGLMHTATRGVKKIFVAENPEKIQALIANKHQLLTDIMPELTAMFLQLKGSDSFIKHFQGRAGVRSVYRQLLTELRENDEYLVISDVEKWLNIDRKFFEQYLRRRAKMKLNTRIILQNTEQAVKHLKKKNEYNFQVKIMPQKTSLTSTIVIVPHKIIITQVIAPYLSIVIENKSTVQTHHAIFEMLWNMLSIGIKSI